MILLFALAILQQIVQQIDTTKQPVVGGILVRK
jgi:hypothetical protein